MGECITGHVGALPRRSPLPQPRVARLGGVVLPSLPLVAVVLVVTLLAVWWHGPLLDLHIYRLGGMSARHGGSDLYTLRDDGTGLPFTYPPFAALVFAPLAVVSEPTGTVLMTVLSLVAAVRLSGLIAGNLDLRPGRQKVAAGVVLLALCASEPVISTVLYGQINMLLFAVAAEAFLRTNSRWALIGLGIAAGIKLTPAIFIVGLFACGRWRDGATAAAAAVGTVLIGAVYLGGPTLTFFGGAGFQDTRIGGTDYIGNQSINGLFWRLDGPGGHRVWWALLALLLGIAAMWSARVFASRSEPMLALGTITLAGLLISPVSWSHHWVGAVLIASALLRPLFGGDRLSPVDRPENPSTSAALTDVWGARRVALRTILRRLRSERRLILGALWAIVTTSWVIWLVPHGNDVEVGSSFADFLLGNAYVELGLITVVALTWHAWHCLRRV